MDFIQNYRKKVMENLRNLEMKNGYFKILQINDLPGYPLYPPNEDIYRMNFKVKPQNIEDIHFEDLPKNNENPSKWNEKTFEEDPSGDDLDVPGSEDDDEQEAIGNEDEENNLYSLSSDEQSDPENDED